MISSSSFIKCEIGAIMITTSYDSLKEPTPSCDHVNSLSFAPQSDKSSTVSSSESSSERSSHLASSRTPIYLGTTCLYIFLVIHSKVSLISFAVNCHSCPLWSTQKNTDSKASTRNVVGDETRLEMLVILSILSFDTDGVDLAPSCDSMRSARACARPRSAVKRASLVLLCRNWTIHKLLYVFSWSRKLIFHSSFS